MKRERRDRPMEIRDILKRVDHTELSVTAGEGEIRRLCDEALRYGTASVCVPPAYVGFAAEYLGGRIPVCTVIGFPNGYATTAVKVAETEDAIRNGADEIDMVIRIGALKEGDAAAVLDDIRAVRGACIGKVLKVIVETCRLTEDEKKLACRIVSESGADYIKTSTGFGGGGATREDIALFRAHSAPDLRIKAAGGISSFQDAEDMLTLGADRLGTSRLVRLAEEINQKENDDDTDTSY
jgi:deoxyribose-phosphate aldolase